MKSARTVGAHGRGKIRHPKAYRVSRIGQAVMERRCSPPHRLRAAPVATGNPALCRHDHAVRRLQAGREAAIPPERRATDAARASCRPGRRHFSKAALIASRLTRDSERPMIVPIRER